MVTKGTSTPKRGRSFFGRRKKSTPKKGMSGEDKNSVINAKDVVNPIQTNNTVRFAETGPKEQTAIVEPISTDKLTNKNASETSETSESVKSRGSSESTNSIPNGIKKSTVSTKDAESTTTQDILSDLDKTPTNSNSKNKKRESKAVKHQTKERSTTAAATTTTTTASSVLNSTLDSSCHSDGSESPSDSNSCSSGSMSLNSKDTVEEARDTSTIRNYLVKPTLLFKYIENMEWESVLERCKNAPEEASTWMVRYKDANNIPLEDEYDVISLSAVVDLKPKHQILWKLLPLHAAIIYLAPPHAISALIKAYPYALRSADDRKMLPIHICCKILSHESVVDIILDKYPRGLRCRDYKGRTPLSILHFYHQKSLNTMFKSSAAGGNKERTYEMNARKVLMNLLQEYEQEVILDHEESRDFSGASVDKSAVTQKTKNTAMANYDTDPTFLVKLIERKMWKDAIERCEQYPSEASVWMCRMQDSDKQQSSTDVDSKQIRWKILPLHSAIVLHAPVSVIRALLEAYPNGVTKGDDRKMLPLHMAFRLGSEMDIVEHLVESYPEALHVKDAKGHTPIFLLKSYRKKYQKELKRDSKKKWSEVDENRQVLIDRYLGSHIYEQIVLKRDFGEDGHNDEETAFTYATAMTGGGTLYDSDSESDSEISLLDSDSDSSDDDSLGDVSYIPSDYPKVQHNDSLFYKEMFSDFGRLTMRGLGNCFTPR
eukprot:CAMPEP_0184861384 /NCGR_PEP_ID=MMETSP0580-20130426/6083_1 /TAXON_ID=1118495 /ORGANISM="Dactyliosolen fragilissimus" /LENGTH=714 /DNA_ID=CAMNT_0027358865 /DNA_START=168 /DNA_END=2312 /DNA_ORIENTATION=+